MPVKNEGPAIAERTYVAHIIIHVPGSEPVVYVGQSAERTGAQRDDFGRLFRQVESASITLGDGSELVLPAGIMAHTYFVLVPAEVLGDGPWVPGGAR